MQRWNSKREMMGDDPPYLAVGTEVSAKYKGAFCEAKVRKVVRSVKCKVAFKLGLGTTTVTDDQIRGTLRAGVLVEVKHPEKKEYVEATITKIQDCSQYTVVFDDGDITTLRRTALCLKSGRHFAESETLDQLPLTHPEHFSNPVIGGRRGRRNRQDDSSDDEELVRKGKQRREEKEADIGKVVCVEISEKKKQKDNWFPGLVVAPTAQDTVRIHVREEYLVRSFKDGRYYTVPKKEATPFTREIGLKVDNNTLRTAVDKALLFLDRDELPPHWDRELLFGLNETSNSDSDPAFDSDTSDDEPREEKDHFVAQLYKFMDDRGTPINKGPTIATKDVDLYRLFKVVHKLGGYNRVTNHNQWKVISHKLGFGQSASTVNLVKHAYKKFLHSFEDFYRKLGCTMVNHPRNNRARHRSNRSLIRDRDRALMNKEKLTDKEGSDEAKEVPAVEVEDSSKSKEDEKPKEAVDVTYKSIRDCRKETPRSKSKEDKTEKKDDKLNTKEHCPQSKKVDNEPAIVKSKESKVDEREDRIKVRESVKVAESASNVKLEIKQEKESLRSRKDKDTVSKESVEKEAPKINKNVQLTRSKSKEEVTNKLKKIELIAETKKPTGVTTPSVPPTLIPQSQSNVASEAEKKRGRKKRDDEKGASNDEVLDQLPSYKTVSVGDKLKVYYGPTHESKVTYEAKVLNLKEESSETMYLVHYTGWNTRYDEWIKRSRIADNLSWSPGRVKRNRMQQPPPHQLQQPQPQQNLGHPQTQQQPAKQPTQQSPSPGVTTTKRSGRNLTASDNSPTGLSNISSPSSSSVMRRSTTPLSTVRTPTHATRTYSRARQRIRHVSGHTEFSESDSEVEFDSDSDLETSNPVQKRPERTNSGDEKDENNFTTKSRRRTSSLMVSSIDDKRDEVTASVTTKRKLLSTSEDEREGKKALCASSSKTLEDKPKQAERKPTNRASVEKELKCSEEVSTGSERLRGRKLRSDKVNNISDSEGENDSQEHISLKREMRRSYIDRQKHNDTAIKVTAKGVHKQARVINSAADIDDDEDDGDDEGDGDDGVACIDKDDSEDSKPLLKIRLQNEFNDCAKASESDVEVQQRLVECSSTSSLRNKNDKCKTDGKFESNVSVKEESNIVLKSPKDEVNSQTPPTEKVKLKAEKKNLQSDAVALQSPESTDQVSSRTRIATIKTEPGTKTPQSSGKYETDSDRKECSGDDEDDEKITTLIEDIAIKQEPSSKGLSGSTETSTSKLSTNSTAKKRIIKTDKRRSDVANNEKSSLVDAVVKEEHVEDGGERRRSRRVPVVKKDDSFKIVPKDEPVDEQPKGRDFDLIQIRSELKGIEKAVKVPIEHSDNKFESSSQNTETKESGTAVLKIKQEVSPLREIDMTADDIYEFKEPEPFEFEVRPKCSDEKGNKLQRRTFGRMCDDLNKNISPLKRKHVRPIKQQPPPTDDRKRFRKTFSKLRDDNADKPKLEVVKSSPISVIEEVGTAGLSVSSPSPTNATEYSDSENTVVISSPVYNRPKEEINPDLHVDDTPKPFETFKECESDCDPITPLAALETQKQTIIMKPENVKQVVNILDREESVDDDSEDRLVISEADEMTFTPDKPIESINTEKVEPKAQTLAGLTNPVLGIVTPMVIDIESKIFSSPFQEPEVASFNITESENVSKQQNMDLLISASLGKKHLDEEELKITNDKAASEVIKIVGNDEGVKDIKCEEVEQEEEEEMEDDAISAAIQRVIAQAMTDDESNDTDLIGTSAQLATTTVGKPLLTHLPPSISQASVISTATHIALPIVHASRPSAFAQNLARRDGGGRRKKTNISKEFIDDTDSESDDNASDSSTKKTNIPLILSEKEKEVNKSEKVVVITASGITSVGFNIIKSDGKEIRKAIPLGTIVSYPSSVKSAPSPTSKEKEIAITPKVIHVDNGNNKELPVTSSNNKNISLSSDEVLSDASSSALRIDIKSYSSLTTSTTTTTTSSSSSSSQQHQTEVKTTDADSDSTDVKDKNKFLNISVGASSPIVVSSHIQNQDRTKGITINKIDVNKDPAEDSNSKILMEIKACDIKNEESVIKIEEDSDDTKFVKTVVYELKREKDESHNMVVDDDDDDDHDHDHDDADNNDITEKGLDSHIQENCETDKEIENVGDFGNEGDPTEDKTLEPDVLSSEAEDEPELEEEEQEKMVIKEEDEECVQSLLCEETIPGSPAPPVFNQKDEKDPEEIVSGNMSLSTVKSAELPFASAPGTSLQTGSPAYTKSVITQPTIQQLPIQPTPQAAPVMDNTPPTTPESSLSPISNSPRGERSGSSPGLDNDSSKSHRESSEIDMDGFPDHNKMGNYSEEDSVCLPGTNLMKKQPHSNSRLESDSLPCKKRRRSRKRSDDTTKRAKLSRRSPRNPPGSDSDDTSENSFAGSTLDLVSSRSPKPSKNTGGVQLDPHLDGPQRISVLLQKLQDLRKNYMSLKAELACIDRRRKKLRRREKEEKDVKQEVPCS